MTTAKLRAIIRERYKMKTAEEILKYYGVPEINITYAIKMAMTEFAAQEAKREAIEVLKWISKSGYFSRLNGEWDINILGVETKPVTHDELYTIYNNRENKK